MGEAKDKRAFGRADRNVATHRRTRKEIEAKMDEADSTGNRDLKDEARGEAYDHRQGGRSDGAELERGW